MGERESRGALSLITSHSSLRNGFRRGNDSIVHVAALLGYSPAGVTGITVT